MMKHKFLFLGILGVLLAACSEDSLKVNGPEFGLGREIRLQAEIDQVNLTRADDSGFAGGDRIGVFAVSYTSDMNPGTLQASGNLADNVRFTFDETSFSWKGDRQLYFLDEKTPVDFYGCYPYDTSIDEVNEYKFSVQRNQATENSDGALSGYEASDFLWAKSAGITPSTPLVNLTFKHILAAVQVTLIEGNSFAEGEWSELNKEVMMANTNRNAIIDLSSGTVRTNGTADDKDIMMKPHYDDFRAIVVPQSVVAGKALISITVGGHSYAFVKSEAMNYLPSKLHKFTIQVDKADESGDFVFTLVDEAVTAWESDPASHNGKVKEYITVEVPERGGLEEAIKTAHLDPAEIVNLKIKGELNEEDFNYMRNKIKYLEALNLREVLIYDCNVEYCANRSDYSIPYEGCSGLLYLKTIVFPEKLKKIGELAFRNTNLTGSLIFPEGLEYIGGSAFSNWQADTASNTNLSGTLSLPSTLK